MGHKFACIMTDDIMLLSRIHKCGKQTWWDCRAEDDAAKYGPEDCPSLGEQRKKLALGLEQETENIRLERWRAFDQIYDSQRVYIAKGQTTLLVYGCASIKFIQRKKVSWVNTTRTQELPDRFKEATCCLTDTLERHRTARRRWGRIFIPEVIWRLQTKITSGMRRHW